MSYELSSWGSIQRCSSKTIPKQTPTNQFQNNILKNCTNLVHLLRLNLVYCRGICHAGGDFFHIIDGGVDSVNNTRSFPSDTNFFILCSVGFCWLNSFIFIFLYSKLWMFRLDIGVDHTVGVNFSRV